MLKLNNINNLCDFSKLLSYCFLTSIIDIKYCIFHLTEPMDI